jgi:hypothetical protein
MIDAPFRSPRRVGFVLVLTATLVAGACSSAETGPEGSPGGKGFSGTSSGGSASGGGPSVAGAGTAGIASAGGVPGAGSGGNSAGAGSGAGGGSGTASGGTSGGGASSGSATGGGATGGSGGSTTGGSVAGSAGASSGTDPVLHIFMLMGQSNMAGVAKSEASDKNTDQRLLVWGGCNQPAGKWNTANPPLNDCPGEKGWNLSDSVDPGIWFGKTLLDKLPQGHTIGLVGTAESGESINTFISGGTHHQMILNKIAAVKGAKNARFEGIIFHQGESDNGQSTWPAKVVQLYNEVKAAFGVSYDVPFILGELPQGGCCAGHNTQVHAAADLLPKGAWVSQEGTKVLDEYHFDHASVVIMGKRYGESMIQELNW